MSLLRFIEPQKAPIMIDLFAGAGGLSQGLEQAGFCCIWAVEKVPAYAQTYQHNHAGTVVCNADIRQLDAEALRKQLGLERGELALIAGGPPCQGFSINAPMRSTLDERNHLFKEYLRFVEVFAPQLVLIENVTGLVSFAQGATLKAILQSLEDLGYGADVRILAAPHYGIPQVRWRTMILGIRGQELPVSAYPIPFCQVDLHANFACTFEGRALLQNATEPVRTVESTEDTAAETMADTVAETVVSSPVMVNTDGSAVGSKDVADDADVSEEALVTNVANFAHVAGSFAAGDASAVKQRQGQQAQVISRRLEVVCPTVYEALGDLPPLANGEQGTAIKPYGCDAFCAYQRLLRKGSKGVVNHEAPRLSAINMERLSYIKCGGDWRDIPHELLPKGMQKANKSDHTQRYGRVSPNGLASTILTKCDPHWGAFFHYDQERSFTVREAARLQSFPDRYVFLGSRVEQYAQVGNAVPPLLAQAVGESLLVLLRHLCSE